MQPNSANVVMMTDAPVVEHEYETVPLQVNDRTSFVIKL